MNAEQLSDYSSETPSERRWSFRTVCGWVLMALLLATAIVVRISVMTTSVRLLLVITIAFGLFVGILHLLRFVKFHHAAVYPVIFFLMFAVLWNVLGNKPYDVNTLRQAYMKRLHGFGNVPFVRGGETTNGIDCSGLARVGLWRAMLQQGITQMNPRLLGSDLWRFWWTDVSARDILLGKHGYTRVTGYAAKLAGYDTSKIKLGDMAVADGMRVMIFCGKGQWIEANPDDGKVVINAAPANSKRAWFNKPVTLVRWRFLEEGM